MLRPLRSVPIVGRSFVASILCKSLTLEPSVGAFFHFYGTKDVNKGTWISICAHAGKRLFPPYALNFKKEWQIHLPGEKNTYQKL